MPVGDVPGWRQVFSEDFATPAAEGQFPGTAYRGRWGGYDGFATTHRTGSFETTRTTSVHDGHLDIHLRTEGGKALGSAPTPLLAGSWAGQKYGRYVVRFRADSVPGYQMAWLLWPDSDVWSDGEIDFPEGDVGGQVSGFVHCLGNPAENCFATKAGTTAGGGWHTATTEWTASGVRFLMDGVEVGRTSVSPRVPMHWVLQTEPGSSVPSPSASGHVLVDWVSIYQPA